MNKFLILSSQRSGSTFFRKYIDSHSEIDCRGEIFIRKQSDAFVAGEKYHLYCSEYLHRRILSKIGAHRLLAPVFIDEFYSNGVSSFKAKGFKLMYNQYKKHKISMNLLNKKNIKIIHFVRSNVLKRLISQELLLARGVAHSNKKLPVLKIRINEKKLLKRLRMMVNEENHFRNVITNNDHIEVKYETFVRDKNEEIRKILKFLNIEKFEELSTDLKKVNPNDLKKILVNYSEIKQIIAGTEFEEML